MSLKDSILVPSHFQYGKTHRRERPKGHDNPSGNNKAITFRKKEDKDSTSLSGSENHTRPIEIDGTSSKISSKQDER